MVAAIEYEFLVSCESLTALDLSALTQVTSIGDFVLSKCTSLRSIDLSKLASVTSIGQGFLMGCKSLPAADLSGMIALTAIGDFCLCECRALASVCMSGLTQITSIGRDFLADTSVRALDLSNLVSLTSTISTSPGTLRGPHGRGGSSAGTIP
jgi:hypothetical protein